MRWNASLPRVRTAFRSPIKAAFATSGQALFWAIFVGHICFMTGCRNKAEREVVVYASQDQVFAEPLFAAFTRETGIVVKAVFDSEAVKTVGLVNRLIAEAPNPRCDVFWNNEEFRTRLLERRGVLRTERPWASFGERRRVLAVNTNLLASSRWPRGVMELTNVTWRTKVTFSYPMFGTTASHFMVLHQRWEEGSWERWCRAFAANVPKMVDGNSVAARLVARGEAEVALTDSDDLEMIRREGAPVAGIALGEDGLMIPNTVAVLRGAPHPDEAEALFQFLLAKPAIQKLAVAGAIHQSADAASEEPVDWEKIFTSHERVLGRLKELFLR